MLYKWKKTKVIRDGIVNKISQSLHTMQMSMLKILELINRNLSYKSKKVSLTYTIHMRVYISNIRYCNEEWYQCYKK